MLVSECPPAERIAQLVEGRLGGVALAQTEEHLGSCAQCRELVSSMAVARGSREGGGATGRVPSEGSDAEGSPVLQQNDRVGRYVIQSLVGTGGMGRVYAAYDPSLDRRVALKLLRPEVAATDLESRLLREAKAMARITHPHVVTVHDAGRYEDYVYIAMEFVEGGTLRDWLRGAARPWREIVEVFALAGEGLAEAHAAGIVHRDFKPDNVLIGEDGKAVRVTDFGLARAAASVDLASLGEAVTLPAFTDSSSFDAQLTRTGILLGTPVYMAPEQHAGQPADARSDVFAFCVALHEALYGERPFSASTLAGLHAAKLAHQVRAAPKHTRVPQRVRRIVLWGLAADPARRPQTMVALLSALRAAVRGTATVRVAGAAVLAASALAAVVAMGARHPASIARPSPPATTSRPTPPSPQLRRLTNNTPERNLDADASPDGKQLAFVDNGAVRVREIATGVERSISLPVGLHAVPGTVSFVDDRRVLFLADDAAQASRYYTAELGGAPAAPLPLRWESLSLSGDGAQAIATVTGDGGKGTETAALVDLTSGAERSLGALPPEASDLAPSPDASHIAWIHAKRLMVAAAAAPIVGHPVLEDPRLMLTGEGEALAWVDASSLLVVMRDAPNADSTNLWRVKLDSTGEASAGAAEKLTDWNDITITHVKVLGDRTVALRRSQTRYRAMVADVPPGTRHLVGLRALTKSGARERAGAWTGDGKSVLATSDATGRWGIYARPLDDTKEELPLRLDNVPQTWPELAADGRTLFYWAFVADGGMPPAQLMRSSLDGDPHAAAVPVLTSSDRTPWTGGKPMPKSSALRCPARASRCLLGDWNSAAGTVRWAWVDPASGGLEDLPLTTTVVGTFTWDVTPDGRQLWTARAPKPVTAPQTIQIFSLDAPGRPPEELRCDGAFNGFSIDRDGSGAWSGSTSSVRFCRRDGHQEDEWTWSDESWVGGLRASPDGRHVAFTQRTEVADVWLATDVIAERKP